ncbi:MAG: hypothetical protein ACRET0_07660 [Steroidobacteraceae bacterium]
MAAGSAVLAVFRGAEHYISPRPAARNRRLRDRRDRHHR